MSADAATRSWRLPAFYLGAAMVALAVSAIAPTDFPTWAIESAPVVVAIPILILTRRRLPLTDLAYTLIFLQALALLLGAHYTYSATPPGFWVRDLLDLERNSYDRFGHFMHGFGPAIVTREILLRCSPLRRGRWLHFLVASVCLAMAALHELLEWLFALVFGGGELAFLGTQGDVWDAQWDMSCALIGAVVALVLLRRLHDRQLERLEGR